MWERAMDHPDASLHAFRVGLSNPADALSTCFSTSYAGIIAFMAVATEGSTAICASSCRRPDRLSTTWTWCCARCSIGDTTSATSADSICPRASACSSFSWPGISGR
ncbi:hypothetical protein BCAR13_10086 [Paraburkholderia caribensis]|nr:hypothetical protein BCAR13_10086 [Paraburkholderia caribensis]